ncbi:MAG: sterol desaturase family protein, partial [Alphaproteobacteria bacterium]|nr:sterol desaturase family protein [Alphaproteobacteria bacterium]
MITTMIVLGVGLTMFIIELLAPGRQWPKVASWWTRAVALNGVQAAMVFIAGVTWDRWLQGVSLWNAEAYFGTNGGAIFGYLTITFIYYWWHRARHEVPILWRWFHQVHHSPQRL